MRLEQTIGDVTHWVELKDTWSQRDMRAWRHAGELTDADFVSAEAMDAAADRVNAAKLELLSGWSTGCHIVDLQGNVYERIDDLTAEAMLDLDAPLYAMLQDAATRAWAKRSSLGNSNGARS